MSPTSLNHKGHKGAQRKSLRRGGWGAPGGWSRGARGPSVLKSRQFLLSEMLPEIQNLIELQRADREILRLKEEVAALPKRVAAIEERLAGTKVGLEKAKTAVKADEAARRKYETAILDSQQKISKYRDQSLEVKTNEQYKALMHEIQFAEQEIRANEDKILELMVNAEAREKDVKAAEAELKAETKEIEKEKIEARERTAEDEKQRDRMEQEDEHEGERHQHDLRETDTGAGVHLLETVEGEPADHQRACECGDQERHDEAG